MKKPFFSIVIPAHNRKALLKVAIESVLNQSYENFELLVIDDGSTDSTAKMVKSLTDKRLVYLYQEKKGPAAARNLGIKKAKADWVCFLDSDDRFRLNKLGITHKYIKANPKYKIFHSEELWYRNGQILPQKIYHQKPHGLVFEKIVKICSISMSTIAIKKEVFKKIGILDETLHTCEDYDFWLRTTSHYPVFLIPQYLTIKEGGHSDQQSKKFEAMDKFRIYAINKILKQGRLNKKQYLAASNELINKCQIYLKGAKKRNKTKEINYYQGLLDAGVDRCADPV